jgi:hypothetical protein
MNSTSRFRIFLMALCVVAFAVPAAFAQGMGGGMGSGMGRRAYNPKTETTVSGTIEAVKTISHGGRGSGTHLDLKTESGIVDVRLGPTHYIASKGFHFAKGDKIEVTGSKVTLQGQEAIIAREVKMGDKVLTLRDAQGIPEWSGGARKGRGVGASGSRPM